MKFKPNKNIFWVFFFIGIVVFFFLITPPKNFNVIIGSFEFLTIVWVAGILITRFTFIEIKQSELKYVEFFVYRKKIKIDQISLITYLPTWKGGGNNLMSLYVFYNGTKKIEIRNSIFPEQVLEDFVSALRNINPSIKLDNSTQVLLKNNK